MDMFKEVNNMFNLFLHVTPKSRSLKDGSYVNSKGNRVGTVRDGSWSWTTTTPAVGSKEWLQKPQVQEQLRGVEQLYKREVIRAIHEGRTPPHSVGVGTYTRETLQRDWNDEWEAIAKRMGIKLFEKRKTGGTPNADIWVDANRGSELKFTTQGNVFFQQSSGNTVTVTQTKDGNYTVGGPPR